MRAIGASGSNRRLAADLARHALDIADGVQDEDDVDLGELDEARLAAHFVLGQLAVSRVDYERATRHLEAAYELMRAGTPAEGALRLRVLARLASTYAGTVRFMDVQGQPEVARLLIAQARALSDEAAELLRTLPSGGRGTLAVPLADTAAMLADDVGDHGSAAAFIRGLLDAADAPGAAPPDVRGLVEMRYALAGILIDQGDTAGARDALRPVLAALPRRAARKYRRRYRWAAVHTVLYRWFSRLETADHRILSGPAPAGAPEIGPSPLGPLPRGVLGGLDIPERAEFRPGVSHGVRFVLSVQLVSLLMVVPAAVLLLLFTRDMPIDLYWIALLCAFPLGWSLVTIVAARKLARFFPTMTVLSSQGVWDDTKLIRWDEVTGAHVVRGFLDRRVRITRTSGRPLTLTQPKGWAWRDGVFDAQAETVRHWVSEYAAHPSGRDGRTVTGVRAAVQFAAVAAAVMLIAYAVAARGVVVPWGPAARTVPGACSLEGPALDRIMPVADRALLPRPAVPAWFRESSVCEWTTTSGWRTMVVTIMRTRGITGLASARWVSAAGFGMLAADLGAARPHGGVGDEAVGGTAADGHRELVARKGNVLIVLAFYGSPPEPATVAELAGDTLGRVAYS